MTYKEWRGMNKQAGIPFMNVLTTASDAVGDTARDSVMLLLAAGGAIGGGAGYLAAKMNAHDKQDIDTIQKEYENERLKADLGYLSSKAKTEADALKNQTKPKAARIFA